MPADDERDRVLSWRLTQALALNVPYDDALTFAISEADLNELRDLVGGGCDPHMAARIVA